MPICADGRFPRRLLSSTKRRTRLGEGSKMVVTGDLTQTDLPEGKTSGLKQAVSLLKGVEDIAVCTLSDKDVVRHPLVSRIVRAYERDAAKRGKGEKQ